MNPRISFLRFHCGNCSLFSAASKTWQLLYIFKAKKSIEKLTNWKFANQDNQIKFLWDYSNPAWNMSGCLKEVNDYRSRQN